ncbi:Probable cytochrome P450 49a1 [Eumeta japonica]|uniref:Probable cytochrome P450 49a1 n=1 Tax=Eumeta variegata TaxID=151549 RepID=A0A4C1WWQ9_EUMVA|nr:Probable cytochrome P450 49a1 [Eumeta japonica]
MYTSLSSGQERARWKCQYGKPFDGVETFEGSISGILLRKGSLKTDDHKSEKNSRLPHHNKTCSPAGGGGASSASPLTICQSKRKPYIKRAELIGLANWFYTNVNVYNQFVRPLGYKDVGGRRRRRRLTPPPPTSIISKTYSARAARPCSTAASPAPSDARRGRCFTELPGPLALPMLKHSAHILPRIGDFHHSVGLGLLDRLQKRYGNLVRLARGSRARPVLYVFDPRLMQQVYDSGATAPPRWENSPLAVHGSQNPTCQGENDGVRSSLRQLLQDPNFVNNYYRAFEEIAADATRRLAEVRHAENALNEEFETEIYRWALEALGVVMLGVRLGCLDGSLNVQNSEKRSQKTSLDDDAPELCSLSKKSAEECTPAERLVKNILDITRCGMLIRSEETLNTQSNTFNEALAKFDTHLRLVDSFLNDALKEINQDDRPEASLLRQLRPLGGRLTTFVANFLLAGVDPLAHTAIAMLYHMSLHAASQQRAHDELAWLTLADSTDRDHRSSNADATGPVRVVKHPMDLPYIAACVQEALRLHPATGGVVRRSRVAFTLDGYEIPPGTPAQDNSGSLQQSSRVAGTKQPRDRVAKPLSTENLPAARAADRENKVPGRDIRQPYDAVDIVLAHGVASKSDAEWGRARAFIPDRWCAEGWEPLRASRAHRAACKPFGESCPASIVVPKILGSLAAKILERYRLEWHGAAPNMATDGVNRLQPPYYFVLQDAS